MLVTVILLILVLGILGTWLAGNLARSQAVAGLDAIQVRVTLAARSGLEWGRQRARSGNCAPSASVVLDGLQVTVSCTAWSAVEDGTPITVARLTATAANGSWDRADFVRRTVHGQAILP